MHIKGPRTPFTVQPADEPKPKESGSVETNAVPLAGAHLPTRSMPSSDWSSAYLLRKQLAAHSKSKRRTAGKAETPAESGATRLDTGSAQAVPVLPLTPATAITKLLLGTPDEKTAAQKYLADAAHAADAIIGANHLTVAAEAALWNNRRLGRPGF